MGGKLEEVSVLVYKLEALRRQDTHPHRHDFNMYILNDFWSKKVALTEQINLTDT